MNKRKTKPATVLKEHKRVGKRFIPPLKQLRLAESVSYVDSMLPELVWLGLLNERHGYIHAARIMEQVFKSADHVAGTDHKGNFALTSTYKKLSDEQKSSLTTQLGEHGVLMDIRNACAPLVLLYEDCPLSFFGPPTHFFSRDTLISDIKNCVGKTINKYDTPRHHTEWYNSSVPPRYRKNLFFSGN